MAGMPRSRTCKRHRRHRGHGITSTVIATRGERLVLSRARFSGRDQGPDVPHGVSASSRSTPTNGSAALVAFDPDDIDAAFEELDARYLAGEAAAHAHTWSVIARAYAALNRHELPATTPDWVNIDHRRGTAFAPGDLTAYVRAAWDLTPDFSIYIEAVHRLSDLGAVVTQASHGTSQEGFDAEWREIELRDGRRRPGQPHASYSTRQTSTPRSPGSTSSSRRRGGWKTRQAEWTSASGRSSRPATGTPWRRYWPTTLSTDDRRRS